MAETFEAWQEPWNAQDNLHDIPQTPHAWNQLRDVWDPLEAIPSQDPRLPSIDHPHYEEALKTLAAELDMWGGVSGETESIGYSVVKRRVGITVALVLSFIMAASIARHDPKEITDSEDNRTPVESFEG